MVQGQPLQYSNLYFELPPVPNRQYQFFYKHNYFNMTDATEDLLTPCSPNSIQSDSDNSISSTDVVPKSIISKKQVTSTKCNEIKCCWYQCGIWFESLELLASHVSKAHSSSGPSGLFYCGWEGCSRNNKGFNARYKMLVHVRTHTNEKPHQCCLCEKSFSRAENLKIHSRSHSGEKPYLCPVPGCKKAYSNSSDRFKHTRTHQVEKPYLCKVPGCPKRYTDPSSLRKHVKTYKHFVCDQNVKLENQDLIINDTSSIRKQVKTFNHFICDTNVKSENQVMIGNINNELVNSFFTSKEESRVNLKTEKNHINNIVNNQSCSCLHNCCLKNCLNKAAELLKLSTLINLNRTDLNCQTWNRLLDPLVQQTRNICVNYRESQMEIDVPLDLTVHRKYET